MSTEMKRSAATINRIEELLGDEARSLLDHKAQTIPKDQLHLPGPDFIDRVVAQSDRSPAVLRSLQSLISNGRLAGTGYVSILPVDQGVEHSAGASFAPNPQYFDPENIVKLAIEGGCNGVASTFGVLGSIARKYAHKIPFIVKINHNELLTLPNKFDQVLFGTVKEAKNLGAVAVGATIYFGSDESTRQITEISQAFALAHELGMACVIWCYLRNSKFKTPEGDMQAAADLTGQANQIGLRKYHRLLPWLTTWGWPVFSGAICATLNSKPRKATCTPQPILPDKRITSASPFRQTSSNRNYPNVTAAIPRSRKSWESHMARPVSWYTRS